MDDLLLKEFVSCKLKAPYCIASSRPLFSFIDDKDLLLVLKPLAI